MAEIRQKALHRQAKMQQQRENLIEEIRLEAIRRLRRGGVQTDETDAGDENRFDNVSFGDGDVRGGAAFSNVGLKLNQINSKDEVSSVISGRRLVVDTPALVIKVDCDGDPSSEGHMDMECHKPRTYL